MIDRDLYKVLGVDEKASPEQIKKAFRRLARRLHPDKTKGDKRAEERFKEVNEAYEILGDEKKRTQYDALRRGPNPFANFGGAGTGPGRGGGRAFSGADMGDFMKMGGEGGFSSIFESLFGGGGVGAGLRTPRQGRDIAADLAIPFEMAVRGGAQKITIRTEEGGAPSTKEVTVKIPSGIKDGQKIRLAGQGDSGAHGGPPGSLMITIHVQPHPAFTRKGADIYSSLKVDLATAMLGGAANVRTIDKTVTLKIPPGTQPGQQFKIRGHGGPLRDGSRADHYATIDVALPGSLDGEQQRLFEAFAQSLGWKKT